ncbi:hypothetical protein E4U53_007368 [Claviceps sorghi]|nr:hypothetical protein E4U53_007368 [Claviceps sorghi]
MPLVLAIYRAGLGFWESRPNVQGSQQVSTSANQQPRNLKVPARSRARRSQSGQLVITVKSIPSTSMQPRTTVPSSHPHANSPAAYALFVHFLEASRRAGDPTVGGSPLAASLLTVTLDLQDIPSALRRDGCMLSHPRPTSETASACAFCSQSAEKIPPPCFSLSALPPPPRYPIGGPYGASGIAGIVPMIETNNTLSTPTGPEWQFLVGEGTYVLKEDLQLATPPPHPSEAPVVNPNPLATEPQPASVGTKMTLVRIQSRPPPFVSREPPAAAPSLGVASSGVDQSGDARHSTEGGMNSEDGRAPSTSDAPSSTAVGSSPAFGEGNSLLMPSHTKDVNKRKKPKNNVTKSNSSFISRVIQDYFTKILFTKAHCLCHDVNMVTKSASHIDVVMGFSTGEIIWWEPISQRYTRMNKNGVINNTPVSHIEWIPGSENLFLAAHMDGSLVVYDKEKDDGQFTPEEDETSVNGSESEDGQKGVKAVTKMHINKSVHSQNQKTNPVAAWKMSNQRINAFAFSPDNRHLAVVSEDGTLRLIDYLQEE